LPFQLLLASPLLAPVRIAGLVRLFRDPGVRRFRFLAWAWAVLAATFLATAGKPYYLGGLLPVLIAAGATPVDRWLERGRQEVRRAVLGGAVVVSAMVGGVIGLPILPVERIEPVVAVHPDVGETIGWPELARTVAEVQGDLPSADPPVILTRNYGEAGAIDRYGSELGLPPAYSGHNGYWDWGPPPDTQGPVILVGLWGTGIFDRFWDCQLAARIENRAGIDNEEAGAPVWACAGAPENWGPLWPRLQRLG